MSIVLGVIWEAEKVVGGLKAATINKLKRRQSLGTG